MHFRHHSTHSTSENAEAFAQDPVGEDFPVNTSQVSLVSQDASHLHRHLSERIHAKIKAIPEHLDFVRPNEEWDNQIKETTRKHMEKHNHHLHPEASLTNLLAGSAAAAGYGGGAVHASTFPVTREDEHGFIAPGYDAPGYDAPGYNTPGYNAPSYNDPGYTQDQYPPRSAVTQSRQRMARIGSQERGVTNGYDDNYEPQLPAPRSTARELADESLSFITGPPSDNANFPQATRRQHSAPAQQPLNMNPPSQAPHGGAMTSAKANLHPAQLQIRPKASTPPYPSQQPTSVQPCTAKVTIKSTTQIINILRQLQIEGFFLPSNVAFLPSQLEERLRKQGLPGAMGRAAAGAGVQVPGCMPDVRSFGGQGEEVGERGVDEGEREVGMDEQGEISGDEGYEGGDAEGEDENATHGEADDEGYESRDGEGEHQNATNCEAEDDNEAGEHEDGYEHGEASDDEGHGEGEEARDCGGEEHGEGEESEVEQGGHEDEEVSEHEDEAEEGEAEEGAEEGEVDEDEVQDEVADEEGEYDNEDGEGEE